MIFEKLLLEKDGRKVEIILREPEKKDARKLMEYYHRVIAETEFLANITPVNMVKEKRWLSEMLKKMRKGNAAFILAEIHGNVAGTASLERKNIEVHQHVGNFGIAIRQEYSRMGLGTRMMQIIEEHARKMKIEIIQLSVYERNAAAQDLYNKMGFSLAGKIPNAVKRE